MSLPVTTTIGGPDELQLTCSSLGASILKLQVPCNDGYLDVITGYPHSDDYLNDPYYMGAMCGRFAGRIGRGAFSLNGTQYKLATKAPGQHALHGGERGFNTRFWEASVCPGNKALKYSLRSCDNDQGFPGNLDVSVTYSIERKTRLVVSVEATCDKDTVVNLVSHAYFNLNSKAGVVDNHRVTVAASHLTVLDSTGVPTGEIAQVSGTRFDLRDTRPDPLGDEQFDQNFVLDKPEGELGLAAVVSVSEHPVCLAVHTTLPGLQLYTGDQLGGVFKPRAGLCLEAQQFPDAPNQPHFPPTILRAGSSYRSETVYAFGKAIDVLEL